MISITTKAAEKIKEISESDGIDHLNLRLKILGGGCSGLVFDMYYDDMPPTDMDSIEKIDDITLYIDMLSLQYMDEVIVDYLDHPIGGGFKFNTPNKNTCACGNSFSS